MFLKTVDVIDIKIGIVEFMKILLLQHGFNLRQIWKQKSIKIHNFYFKPI
jgi:hypothetical protein